MVLSFPSNQFGHQENSDGMEIMNALKYVRPGNGFEPKCLMFDKVCDQCDVKNTPSRVRLFQSWSYHALLQVQVNGEGEHEVFTWLKGQMPLPSDDGVNFMGNPKFIMWQPVKRSDIAWNFEKFLIDPQGKPFKRYSKKFQTAHISCDIDKLVTSEQSFL